MKELLDKRLNPFHAVIILVAAALVVTLVAFGVTMKGANADELQRKAERGKQFRNSELTEDFDSYQRLETRRLALLKDGRTEADPLVRALAESAQREVQNMLFFANGHDRSEIPPEVADLLYGPATAK